MLPKPASVGAVVDAATGERVEKAVSRGVLRRRARALQDPQGAALALHVRAGSACACALSGSMLVDWLCCCQRCAFLTG